MSKRELSLPKSVAAAGGIDAWNVRGPEHAALHQMLKVLVTATNLAEALTQVNAMIGLGNEHYIWAYMYMRNLANHDLDLAYRAILAEPAKLLPVMYTPTVGEACQKFGRLPLYSRGCYLSIEDKGNLKAVLQEYAEAELEKDASGKPICDCIVFSDGGRILGLGDLGTWGMGIPIGKLDLYTVCGGFNPRRTIPAIIDAGCSDPVFNTARLQIREDVAYTGTKKDRAVEQSAAGTRINSGYYGEGNVIEEFMTAATDLFGKNCLLQFEDFNSNDAFPLLEAYREKFLCYNDDIQGTAAVCVAGILGAIKLKNPNEKDLIGALRKETFLCHGAGSANIGTLSLLQNEGKVPATQMTVTNSRGIIWVSEDGTHGNYRNDEQKAFGRKGEPDYNTKDLVQVVKNEQPTCIIGAVGVVPNCFTREVVEAMVESVTEVEHDGSQVQGGRMSQRPIIFALSNPKTQAEVTAENCYKWSDGKAIYGSGTQFDPVTHNGRTHHPGQVNNVYIFPGLSFGAVCCEAKNIPDRFFMVAAEAVANSLDADDLAADRVIPARDRLREVGLNVATATCLEAQKLGLAGQKLGDTWEEVKAALAARMWLPKGGGGAGADAHL